MTRRRALVPLLVAIVSLAAPEPGWAYLVLGYPQSGDQVAAKWKQMPIGYFVRNAGVPGVSPADLEGALGRAFATWTAVPTSSAAYAFLGFTDAAPGDDDGQSTLGFASHPELDRVLAATSFLVDSTTGELLESDIFFNTTFQWSVAASGEQGRFDLESIALHEIGHLSGLAHSALGETTMVNGGRRVVATGAAMFPIAFPAGAVNRTLHADDVAGISDLYPDEGVRAATGSLVGRVTKDGQGVYGAHVVAFNPSTGALVGGFSLDAEGHFRIGCLPPGPYVLRVEPLDDAETDAFLDGAIEVDFRVAFSGTYAISPAGGIGAPTEIHVVSK